MKREMPNRARSLLAALAALSIAGCGAPGDGPLEVSAIGHAPPALVNPNLEPLDPAAAFLIEATGQGLVRFDAGGEIEPGLAQSWIVSDDGLRYTFRLARTRWDDGTRITADQVVARLRAAISPASRNRLKFLLQMIDQIVPMTDEVLEISLLSPRPHFLQLLAQPDMAIVRGGHGTGPLRAVPDEEAGRLLLAFPRDEEAEEEEEPDGPAVRLAAGRAAIAVARFRRGAADLVLGGSLADLPVVRAAAPGGNALAFDPVEGLLGLAFTGRGPAGGDAVLRQALAMAVDRAAIVAALDIGGLQPRTSLVPPGIAELPEPIRPAWSDDPMPMRRARAAEVIAAIPAFAEGDGVIRVGMPDTPGHRLVFAHLRRDWRAIGLAPERVAPDSAEADLLFLDDVAPASLASWYIRHFTCDRSRVCDPVADEMMAGARNAINAQMRTIYLANADRLLAEAAPFIAIAAPVRWSLRGPRATGFTPNLFARHPADALVGVRR